MSNFLKTLTLVFSVFILLSSCKQKGSVSTIQNDSSSSPTEGRRMDNFTYLKKCMQGNFSSEEQSKNDSDFFDIRLRMVPIWKQTNEEFYLYVEQAMSTAQEKPYRQRVYKVVKEDETHFTSYIYLLNDASKFVGKKAGDEIFFSITPDSLKIKDGCEVKLEFDANKNEFVGSTGTNTCPSDRSGAAWATSKVTINDERMISWDQGWNTDGKQVWGAVKGGYIFRKQD
jgi:CpeT protein